MAPVRMLQIGGPLRVLVLELADSTCLNPVHVKQIILMHGCCNISCCRDRGRRGIHSPSQNVCSVSPKKLLSVCAGGCWLQVPQHGWRSFLTCMQHGCWGCRLLAPVRRPYGFDRLILLKSVF